VTAILPGDAIPTPGIPPIVSTFEPIAAFGAFAQRRELEWSERHPFLSRTLQSRCLDGNLRPRWDPSGLNRGFLLVFQR